MGGFKDFHPAILFLYYLVVILTTVTTLNPVIVTLSLIGGVLYYAVISDSKEFTKSIGFYLIVMVIITLTNPVFSHNGETVLIYINNNAITLESILYGIFAGVMIVGIMFWCKCYEKAMTTDKFLYLFGRVMPQISLIISMAIRFIPAFKRQAQNVSDVQKIIGIEEKHGKVFGRLRVYDSVLGWAMENSVDTADAMSARGYGLKKRTSYSIFSFRIWDKFMAAFFAFYIVIFIVGMVKGIYDFSYYPLTDTPDIHGICILFYMMHGVFMLIPFSVQKALERA